MWGTEVWHGGVARRAYTRAFNLCVGRLEAGIGVILRTLVMLRLDQSGFCVVFSSVFLMFFSSVNPV